MENAEANKIEANTPAEKILILGATSSIAEEAAKIWAAAGKSFVLVGRSKAKLSAVAGDLLVRGATNVEIIVSHLADPDLHLEMLTKAHTTLGQLDIVLIAYGSLEDQLAAQTDFDIAEVQITINFTSTVSILTHLLPIFEKQKNGTIAVISSVAGDRGRRSNYVYGASKAGLSSYLQGYRSRLSVSNVNVMTIKPGPVDTPMTAHMKKGLTTAQPSAVAHDIVKAIAHKKDILYTPFYWRIIMGIICHIPEKIFKRFKF